MKSKIAFIYLLLLLGISYGYQIHSAHLFPYKLIQNTVQFIKGHADEKTTVAEKVLNDLGLSPHRLIVDYNNTHQRDYTPLKISNFNDRPSTPLTYSQVKDESGYIALYGTFDLKKAWHGVLLLNMQGKLIHSWPIDLSNVSGITETNVFPHGFSVFENGSIFAGFDDNQPIFHIGKCGNIIKTAEGAYHHLIETTDDNKYLWSAHNYGQYENMGVRKLSIANFDVKKEILFKDIMAANPGTDILGIRQTDYLKLHEKKETPWAPIWQNDFWHSNDVEPLPKKYAAAFPMFNAGDLLISLRSLNLIFVIDPETLKIKWWRTGQTRRQHDPDWQPDGTITVYNNNMYMGYSSLVKINPQNYSSEIIYDGKKENFYSVVRGNHQILENKSTIITVSQQGRVIMVDSDGNTIFEFINKYDDKKSKNLVVSEAKYLPADFFNNVDFSSCSK